MLCDVAGCSRSNDGLLRTTVVPTPHQGGEALRKRCIRGRKLRALIVWKYYRFLAKHCKLRAMSLVSD